jgi:two-component system response regulator HydG
MSVRVKQVQVADALPSPEALSGHSAVIQQINWQIQLVARTTMTVLIQGETGTGKEVVARALHAHSGRAGHPFVAVDCGALSEPLLESALFGHHKGAFTGAECAHRGYFALAHGGTLFLDEIANLPLRMQMKLLRSVQERCIRPLGSTSAVPIDVRLIVAANRLLADEVTAGRFRADLFQRVYEFLIYLPPLRDRPEDILGLAEQFRHEANAELHKASTGFAPEAQAYLQASAWPGNVRELRNAVRRAVLLSSSVIELQHLRQPVAPQKTARQAQLRDARHWANRRA